VTDPSPSLPIGALISFSLLLTEGEEEGKGEIGLSMIDVWVAVLASRVKSGDERIKEGEGRNDLVDEAELIRNGIEEGVWVGINVGTKNGTRV